MFNKGASIYSIIYAACLNLRSLGTEPLAILAKQFRWHMCSDGTAPPRLRVSQEIIHLGASSGAVDSRVSSQKEVSKQLSVPVSYTYS